MTWRAEALRKSKCPESPDKISKAGNIVDAFY